jgi:hypothetical protein
MRNGGFAGRVVPKLGVPPPQIAGRCERCPAIREPAKASRREQQRWWQVAEMGCDSLVRGARTSQRI